MNYVKITATSPFINLSIFVKESDCAKALKGIQLMHEKTPAHHLVFDEYRGWQKEHYNPSKGWINNNFLSVTMRRVIITKRVKALQPVIERSMSKIAA